MTISTQDSKVNYQGNGQTTVFQIPFPFLENNQIYVQKKDAQGNLINYTYATDYTVTGAGEENGGSVTLNVAPEQGSTISIYRNVPLTQEVDYRENEIFPAETHEEALDKLTMEVQQIQEQLDRSVKVDRFSDVDPDIIVKEIERVYDSTDNIDIVANNINNVNSVGDNIANVNTVAGDIDSVVTTATNINDVKTVAQNKASLNITAANINDIKTVSSIKDDVHTVANNSANVTTVATNISSVNTAASNMAAIKAAPTAASNAAKSAANAANSATISANSAIWAEGTDAQVAALGGVHSSKGWAQQSTSVNISLTNTPYTTNRILEIPQDIKLELNNGTLTLKAGSKVYVPNGPGVFDAVTVANDISRSDKLPANTKRVFAYRNDGSVTYTEFTGSGTSAGSSFSGFYYNTTNNVINAYSSGTADSRKLSFPICIVSADSNGQISSIDQIFNGFGYIGSTLFALPGVQVQTPNGKNTDGTYKSVIRTVDSVRTFDAGAWGTKNLNIIFDGSVFDISFRGQPVERFTYNKRFSSDTSTYSYDENTGIWWYSSNQSSWIKFSGNIVGSCRVESGRITSFESYTVDSVLNSSLSNLSAAGQAKFDAKANVSNTVTTDTAQTISGVKTFTANTIVKGSGANNGTFTIKNDVTTYGTSAVDLVVATSNGKNQFLVHFQEGNKWCAYFDQDPSTKNITFSMAECAAVYAPTPPVYSNGGSVATTAWFNSKMQVVSALPAAPDANVFYFIPG